MSRGGYRPGAGRPKGAKDKPKFSSHLVVEVAPAGDAPPVDTPLGFMLQVMNDPAADDARRDKMAIAAAPFMHPRIADNRFGKRDGEKEAAVKAGKVGRFATPATPLKLVVNSR